MPAGFSFLVLAYIIIWIGLLIYLGFIALRLRGVRTELAAIEELVREQQQERDTR
jgi:CcmD family protein